MSERTILKTDRIDIRLDDPIMTIRVDLSQEPHPSSSGKTLTIATLGKPQKFRVDSIGDVYVGLNVFKYRQRKA